MLSFGRVALWALLVGYVAATPTCVESGTSRVTYTCSGFTSHAHFNEHVRRDFSPDRYARVEVLLKDSNLDFLPPRALEGTMASVLEFRNVRVHGHTPETSDGHPFSGVTSWLRKVILSDGSTTPPSWALLSPLTKLEEVILLNMHYVNLSSSFNELPKSVKRVRVLNSTILGVDLDWLARLENLEELHVENSNINHFSRTMLPRPALNLTSLTLRNANLTSLPVDLTVDAPRLTTLNLQENVIHHFDEHSFVPLLNRSTDAAAFLDGNPLDCDCHARFLNQIPDSWTAPPCVTPDRLKGRLVKNIGISQLICAGAGSRR
uniref:Putative secreted peptide n=1 Tax=Rhipicephalus pulchellus TaxID=72859 RepID=L7MBH0_RHIPC